MGGRDRRRDQAAGYQLASGEPIMAMGGFNGSDPTPTLAEFQAYVRRARSGTTSPGARGSRAVAAVGTSWLQSAPGCSRTSAPARSAA